MENGYFFDSKTWTLNTEGRGKEIPWFIALMIMPVIGLAFLMFLPFIGFYLTIQALGMKTIAFLKPIFYPTFAVPGESHLTGGPQEGSAEKSKNDTLEELQKEIDSHRK